MATYGLFKNGKTPDTAMPDFIVKTTTWGLAVKYFAENGFGGGEVFNLDTGKFIATVGGKKRQEVNTDFEKVTQYLMNGKEGDFVKHEDGRRVEITNMAGGRYLCFDSLGRVARQVDDEAFAYNFLRDKR